MDQKETCISKIVLQISVKSRILKENVRERSRENEEDRGKSAKEKKCSSEESMETKQSKECTDGQYWIKSLLLYEVDRKSLEGGGWLSDAHI